MRILAGMWRERRASLALVIIFAMILQLAGQIFVDSNLYAAAPAGVTFTKTADKNEIQVGEEVTYRIDYSNANVTLVGSDITITDQIDMSKFDIVDSEGWIDSAGLFTFNRTLTAGDTGYLKITVKAKSPGSTVDTLTTNTATLTVVSGANSGDSISASANVTVKGNPGGVNPGGGGSVTEVVYDKWDTWKTQNTGIAGNPAIVGGQVTYKVGVRSIATHQNTPAGSIKISDFMDTLPPQATFVSASNGTISNGGSTVLVDTTTTLADGIIKWAEFTLGSGQSFEATVVVNYPLNYGYAASSPVDQTNSVTYATYQADPGVILQDDEASVTTRFGPPKSGESNLSKSRTFQYRWHGQEQVYSIGGISNPAGNDVNSPIENLVLVDELPLEVNYTSIKMPNRAWSKFSYEINSSGLWVDNGYSTVNGTLNISALSLTATDYISKIKWEFAKLDVGQSIGGIEVRGNVLSIRPNDYSPVPHGFEVVNNVTLDYEQVSTIEGDPNTPITIAKDARFNVNNEMPWLQAQKSHAIVGGYPGPMALSDFTLRIENLNKATGPYVDPIIYDLLPKEIEYYTDPKKGTRVVALPDSYKVTDLAGVLLPIQPKIEVIEDYNNVLGQTLVKWYWENPISFDAGTGFIIKYQGQIRAGTPISATGYTNHLYITTENAETPFWYGSTALSHDAIPANFDDWAAANTAIKDATLGFDPTDAVDEYFVHASVNVPVKKQALVQSTKWNRGDLAPIYDSTLDGDYAGEPGIPVPPFESDSSIEYTEYPRYSVTYEGGTADYKLAIRNTGNVRMLKIDVLDILPHVGDEPPLSPGTARNSEWRPNLAEVLSPGVKTFTSSVETGGKTVEYNLETYFSKSVNQATVVNFTNATGGRLGWIPQAAYTKDDLTDIKSLYFELSNFTGSDNQPGLAPGDYVVLDWKMDAPVGASSNEVAWNSFAIRPTTIDNELMLPAAPNKVGFIIDPANLNETLGEIGDFVWFDSNRDGIQNEEFSDDGSQGAGINGVTVNLYKSDNLVTPIGTSKTGYDTEGKPGYYLFQGLPLDQQYVVEFVLPQRYKPTISNAISVDPNHSEGRDSNFVNAGISLPNEYKAYRSDLISITAAKKSNRTIDFGLIEMILPTAPITQYPAVSMEKDITSVDQGSSSTPASQSYVVKGNVVNYSIEVKNNSSVTLHNIKVSDVFDRNQAGFAFTGLNYDGESIVINGNTHNRPDVISDIVNSGVNPYVFVRSLGAGETFVVTGNYTVSEADIDHTVLDNTATVNYNESPEPITDDAEISTAGIKVVKTGSTLSVPAAANNFYIDYIVTIENMGILDLTNLQINDTKVSGIPAIPLLKAGEVKQITYSYLVSAADKLQPEVINVVTVTPNETPGVTDEHKVPVVVTPSGIIGNYVWFDSNEDGIQDAGENGINGITVLLYNSLTGNPIAQTVTKDNAGKAGFYLFQGLPEASYYVQFVIPDDYGVTKPTTTSEALDSNVTNADEFTEAIDIGPSLWDDLTIDLGLVPRGEIGNYVWLDRNRNGLQDEVDSDGLNGIEVRLHKTNKTGTAVEVTTTATKDGKPGYYLFDNLIAGTYYVEFVIPSDYTKASAGLGSDRAKDSNQTDTNGTSEFSGAVVIGGVPGAPEWIDRTIDLGFVAKGAIGNYVWLDNNSNGKQDEVESSGINGVTVKLLDENKVFIGQTITVNDVAGKPGYYLFDHLIAGQYYIEFIIPSGYLITKAEADGVIAAEDSNKLTSGYTSLISIGDDPGKAWKDMTIDLGFVYVPYTPYIPIIPTPINPPESEKPVDPETPVDPVTPVTPGKPTDPITPVKPKPVIEVTSKDKPKEGKIELPKDSKAEIGKEPTNGKVTIDKNGKWKYTPNKGFTGKDSFTIIVTGEDGNQEEILYEINVEALPLGGNDSSNGTTKLPKTGESSSLPIQLMGLGLIVTAAILLRKKRTLRK